MLMRKSGILLFLTLLAQLTSGTANAKSETYKIDVTVAYTPHAHGAISAKQWKLRSKPVTYSGWFTADDTIAGPISDLHLVIAGVDIAKNFSFTNSYFDPSSLELSLAAADAVSDHSTAPNALVLFGNYSLPPASNSQTTNYVAALEPNSQDGTLDTYYGVNQNWSGTLIITAFTDNTASYR
ncbi:MAG: hypothetical protein HGB15_05600 [Chlorobaculum sp.]|jgi:hypothetical protein|nr:hypothetical protein [Chlorobaculum sp.]